MFVLAIGHSFVSWWAVGWKQYTRGKSDPWSINIFAIWGTTELFCNCIMFQGASRQLEKDFLKFMVVGPSLVLTIVTGTNIDADRCINDHFNSNYYLF